MEHHHHHHLLSLSIQWPYGHPEREVVRSTPDTDSWRRAPLRGTKEQCPDVTRGGVGTQTAGQTNNAMREQKSI